VDVALTLIRALLIGVFAVAGVAKLADLSGSRAAVEGFGVPRRIAAPLGTVLPFAELTAAGLLLFGATARAGAALSLALLLAFSAGIARSIARGEAPDCHCFGQLHSEPAGPRTLLRNLSLAGLAAIVVLTRGSAGPGLEDIGSLSAAAVLAIVGGVALALLLVAAALAFLGMLRQHGRLLLRVDALESALRARGIPIPEAPEPVDVRGDGLPVGADAPAFALPALDGETVSLESLRAPGRPVLIAFTDPGCSPCRTLLPKLGAWQREHADRLTLTVVSRGDAAELKAEAVEHDVANVLQEEARSISNAYEGQVTPSAVLVDASGRIASPVAKGEAAIAALVERAARPPAIPVTQVPAAPSVRKGEPLPASNGLTDLDGEPADLADALGGADRVLVFWDPSCGFCRRMLPDLLRLEREEPALARALLLISRGDPGANREQGISSPILLEDGFNLGPPLGARGTPTAVRVDERRRVASHVAVGAEAVFALARGRG
jgi:thiol-disulfide isomerase/thioredoxin/uncharacterized membrane protein YphA (DoxX/SURF4 family)